MVSIYQADSGAACTRPGSDELPLVRFISWSQNSFTLYAGKSSELMSLTRCTLCHLQLLMHLSLCDVYVSTLISSASSGGQVLFSSCCHNSWTSNEWICVCMREVVVKMLSGVGQWVWPLSRRNITVCNTAFNPHSPLLLLDISCVCNYICKAQAWLTWIQVFFFTLLFQAYLQPAQKNNMQTWWRTYFKPPLRNTWKAVATWRVRKIQWKTSNTVIWKLVSSNM